MTACQSDGHLAFCLSKAADCAEVAKLVRVDDGLDRGDPAVDDRLDPAFRIRLQDELECRGLPGRRAARFLRGHRAARGCHGLDGGAGGVSSRQVGHDGKVLAPVIDGRMVALDAKTGAVRWSARVLPEDSTGYSITTTKFSDHVLTLTRTLHDWDANFDFVKAQNGNFSFQFRVHLRANPDVKLDYHQQESPGLQTAQ